MNILVSYRGIPQAPGWATGDALVQAFRQLGHEAAPYGCFYSQPAGLALAGRPMAAIPHRVDLLVCLECNDADPQYHELGALNCPRVYWDFDTEMHADFTAQWIAAMKFDRVFMAHPLWAERFGAQYLPYGVDPAHFNRGTELRDGAGIIGTPFDERKKFADAAGVKIVSGVYARDYSAAVQRLKIHVHHLDSGGAGLLVMRIWETMACETLLMAPRSESMDRHFVAGRHYVPYDSAENCRSLIGDLLADDDTRNQIASSGHEEIMAKHTYLHRARAILAAL